MALLVAGDTKMSSWKIYFLCKSWKNILEENLLMLYDMSSICIQCDYNLETRGWHFQIPLHTISCGLHRKHSGCRLHMWQYFTIPSMCKNTPTKKKIIPCIVTFCIPHVLCACECVRTVLYPFLKLQNWLQVAYERKILFTALGRTLLIYANFKIFTWHRLKDKFNFIHIR